MSHFKGDNGGGDERLYISISPDGINWTALNGGSPVWEPVGASPFGNVVRDPSIIYEGGFFWVAFTSGNYGKHASFGLVKSQDLLHWTLVGEINTTIPGATDPLTWGPIFFRDGDGSIHVMVAMSPTGGSTYSPLPAMHVHEMHPVNADMTQWSAPVALALPHANTNECWVWKEGATYHAAYIAFPTGAWQHSTSAQLVNGWSPAQVLGFNSYEGGMILPRPEGGYRFCAEAGNGAAAIGYCYFDLAPDFSGAGAPQFFNVTVPMRNGKMIAAPATTRFTDWQAVHVADLPTAQQLSSADPDGDGRQNLMEYATALDPRSATDFLVPRTYFIPGTPGQLQLAVAYRRLPSLADVTYVLETAGAPLAFSSADLSLVPRATTLLSDGSELVETVDSISASSGGARFLRLRVTLTPMP
jgi:hypothetical protein